MQPIIYDVAVSADGFICGASDDVSRFPHSGPVVEDYLERMSTYSCALMGRRTYEFGYTHGLPPGANPYPGLQSLVFSASIALPKDAEVGVEIVTQASLERIDELKQTSSGPIYLCGGGNFAGWLLSHERIDMLRLKRAPIFYGSGVSLFGSHEGPISARLTKSQLYDDGVLFQEFALPS
ncbi:MAG: deaminase [Rhodobiaceae bacterium]|nr:deaminase [Rhodobiaceae bacterium]